MNYYHQLMKKSTPYNSNISYQKNLTFLLVYDIISHNLRRRGRLEKRGEICYEKGY